MAFSIRNDGALYDQNSSFREQSGFGRLQPWLSFRIIGIPERSKRPAGVAIGFSIYVLYLGPPRHGGGVEANALLRWPRSRRSSPELADPARTRSGSTGCLFPGVRGAPPACQPRPSSALAHPPAPLCGPEAVTSGLLLGRRGRRLREAGLGGTRRTWAR